MRTESKSWGVQEKSYQDKREGKMQKSRIRGVLLFQERQGDQGRGEPGSRSGDEAQRSGKGVHIGFFSQ